MSTDFLLDSDFQLVPQTNGDAALISGDSCFLQAVHVEAASSVGDLWYAPAWGWSLLDFAGRRQDALVKLEIEQRVRIKLKAHEEIQVESIAVTADWREDHITVQASFRLMGEDELQTLNLNIGRTEIEVIPIAS